MKDPVKIIFIDCQTTGPSPQSSSLLEVGWNESSWVLAQEVPVSPKALKLVGIPQNEVDLGVSRKDLWILLEKSLAVIKPDFAVVHFSRFEKSYLDILWQEFSSSDFPVPIVCSHQIAKRLFPNLPSYGLRALAGWFGAPLPEGKRAAAHVYATRAIWKHLRLELEKKGLFSLNKIKELCSTKVVKSPGAKKFLIPRELRLGLPDKPGIYKYIDRNGRVLYVGKATSLKQRVNSYFTGGCRADHRKLEMLAQAVGLDVVALETPLDAGLLEFDEIRRLGPPYNIAFKNAPQSPIDALDILDSMSHDFSDAHTLNLIRSNFYGLQDPQVLLAGLAQWRKASGLDADKVFEKRHLLSLGLPLLKIWIQTEIVRLKEAALAKLNAQNQPTKDLDQANAKNGEDLTLDDLGDEGLSDEGPSDKSDFVWTPELIAETCPKILRRATRHFLRMKWWKRISGATIDFKPALSPSESKKAPLHIKPSRQLDPQNEPFDSMDPRRIKLLLHELRRAEAKGGTWRVVAPWNMVVPFWV